MSHTEAFLYTLPQRVGHEVYGEELNGRYVYGLDSAGSMPKYGQDTGEESSEGTKNRAMAGML